MQLLHCAVTPRYRYRVSACKLCKGIVLPRVFAESELQLYMNMMHDAIRPLGSLDMRRGLRWSTGYS